MLELSTLVFRVDSTQLKQAHDLIASLGPAMQGVANASGKVDKATQQAGKATEQLGKQAEKASKQIKGQTDLLTKLDLLYEDLAEGSTRWEASTLRAAREMGIPLNDVKKRLEDIRKLTKDPFDSAIGSVRSVTQNFTELQNRIELTNQGLIFTTKQLREFSRIPFEVEGRRKAQGKDTESGMGRLALAEEIAKEQRAYAAKAIQVNELANAEKKRMEVTKQAIQAEKFLATEMQRVDAVMQEMNNEFGLNAITGERSANAVAKYANALERAGIAGVEAAARLETYRNKVQQIAMQDEKRAATRLSRALTPQISDVAVSLAGGMPLHLVIMQQGLQIRDLIAQSGVAAGTLQQVFKTAAADMVKSIGGTVAALGSLTFGALVDAGKAVANFGVGLTGQKDRLNYFTWQLQQGANAGSLMDKSLLALARGGVVAIGVSLGAAVVAAAALTVEYFKLIGANNELARSLSGTQYVFGVGTAGALEYNKALGEMGMSARNGMNLMSQMAATGKLTSADILLVGESALQMQKWVDVAVEDTVKAFAKMKEKPVEALTELAMKTGQVTPELIKMVKELEKQGRTADASGIAMKALADQHKIQVKRMQDDLHPLTKAWIEFKGIVSGVWNGVGQIMNESMGAIPEQQKLLKDLDNLQRNFKFSKGSGQGISNFDDRTYEQEQARITNRLAALRRENETKLIASELNRKQIVEDQKRDEARAKFASREEQRSKALAELEANKSRISAEAYKESKKRIEEQFKDRGAEKAAASAVAYEKSAVEKLNDAYNESIGKVQGLTKVEKALSDIRDDPKYKQGSATYRKGIEDYAKALIGQEKAELEAKEAEEAANKVREKSVELRNQQVEAANKLIQATQQSIAGIDGQIRDVDFNSSVFGLSPELERKLRSEYELKKKYETAGLDFYKEVEAAKSTTSGEMLQEQLQQLGVKYQRSVELAQKQAELENRTLTDQQKRIQGFDAVFKQGFESMADKMIEFAATGEASFGDMIQSMLMELAKLELKMQMMKMYESMGGGSESGILGTLVGMFTGTMQAKGGAWNNGVQMFAKGGVVNRTTAFGMQGGMGIMGEAGPEAIMPLKRGRDGSLGVSGGSGTNVQVIINNNSQAQVQQKETVDSRGNRRVEVTVGDMTAGEIQRNGSSAQRSIGSTFGLQPTLKNR